MSTASNLIQSIDLLQNSAGQEKIRHKKTQPRTRGIIRYLSGRAARGATITRPARSKVQHLMESSGPHRLSCMNTERKFEVKLCSPCNSQF